MRTMQRVEMRLYSSEGSFAPKLVKNISASFSRYNRYPVIPARCYIEITLLHRDAYAYG
ncbi:hypothetical protein K440DRAFT_634848 [Wilcoxina mikolae CBS 423.85]|nr:hypothetical protein K440DRAFT_634848 [Wilcoxina mikolae CBS 423.85]